MPSAARKKSSEAKRLASAVAMQIRLHAYKPPRMTRLRRHTVGDSSGERRAQAVDPGERASKQAKLNLVEVHTVLQQWEHRKDGLAVRVIEERDAPQHADDGPCIGAGWLRARRPMDCGIFRADHDWTHQGLDRWLPSVYEWNRLP